MVSYPIKAGSLPASSVSVDFGERIDSLIARDIADSKDFLDHLFDRSKDSSHSFEGTRFPVYTDDEARLTSNQQSLRGVELGNIPHPWFRGNRDSEIEQFASLRSSVNGYLLMERFQAPIKTMTATAALPPVNRTEPNGNVLNDSIAHYEQGTSVHRSLSNGFDPHDENSVMNADQDHGLAYYGQHASVYPDSIGSLDLQGHLGQMDDYPSNDLDAYNPQISHQLDSPGEFVPLYQDENTFRNRKVSSMAERVISDYPAFDLRAQHNIIARIYNAIINTNDVQDSEKVVAKFKDASIPDQAIHEACWEIMLKCRDSQEMGSLVAKYHRTKHAQQHSFLTRVNSVIETLTKSKSACKQVLAPSFIDRLVDQPNEELKRKNCNQKLNSKKTGQNKAGQQAIAKSMADAAGKWIDNGEFEYEEDQYPMVPQVAGYHFRANSEAVNKSPTSPPRKRARNQ